MNKSRTTRKRRLRRSQRQVQRYGRSAKRVHKRLGGRTGDSRKRSMA